MSRSGQQARPNPGAQPRRRGSAGTGERAVGTAAVRLAAALALAVSMVSVAQDGPMSLDDCIAYAVKHSPELLKLDIAHDTQRFQTVIERAAFAPSITYKNTYEVEAEDRTDTLTLSKDFLGGVELSSTMSATKDLDEDSDSASWSLSLSKQILGGGTMLESRNGIDTSLVNEVIALNKVGRKKRELVYKVKGYFYQVIRNTQSLSIKQRRLDRAKTNLEHAIERERPLDIITAKIQIPDNELAVLSVERGIKDSLDLLKVAMGMPVSQPLSIDEKIAFEIVERDLASDLGYALENHEDFVNNRLEQRKLVWAADITKSNLWPDVTLSASFAKENEGETVNLRGDDEEVLGLTISWPLGRAEDKAAHWQALNNKRSKETDYFILEQSKRRRLTQLHRLLGENAESVRLQEQRVELVSRQVELYRDRWENGEIDILEFIRSENDLESSKVELVTLETEYLELLAEYEFEAGR